MASSYLVLREFTTDLDGRSNVHCRPGETIDLDDEARAAYLLDAGFIGDPAAVAGGELPAAATSDAPDDGDLALADDEAEDPDAPVVSRRTRTRR